MATLRQKLTLAIGLFAVAGAAPVFYSLSRATTKAIAQESESASTQAIQTLSNALAQRSKSLELGITYLCGRQGTRSLGDTDSATAREHLSEIRPEIGCDWLAFIKTDGSVLGASAPFLHPGQSAATIGGDNALDGQEQRGIVLLGGHSYLFVTKPVVIYGFTKGAIAGGIELNSALAKEISRETGAQVAIFRGSMPIARSFSEPWDQRGEAVRSIIQGETYSGFVKPLNRARAKGLYVAALIPESKVAGPFASIRRAVAATFFTAIFLALLGVVLFSKGLLRALDQLTVRAHAIEAGHWPEPIDSKRKDELGNLSRTFDHMTASIKNHQDELLAMLELDPLTGLANGRSFRSKLEAAIQHAVEGERPLGLIYIDLDHFDALNRDSGDQRGDAVLKETAELLRSISGAQAARLVDDEFVVLVEADPAFASAKLLKEIGQRIGLTASIGYALLDENTRRSDLLMLAARMARDIAKQSGRNRVRKFEGFATAGGADELRQFLQHGSYAAIRALAEAVDAKDEYTRGHSTRVAEYARDIARHLGLNEGDLELVYVTGTLHDVGKIGVPDHVLKKQDKLTDEEFEEIKKHPALGEKIVSQLPVLKDTLPGIRSHHERWDGRGYPDGLAGQEISLLARILAIADTFDAMTSDRPYRKGLPVSVAVEVITKGAGSQFDPSLMDAFLAWVAPFEQKAA